MPLPVLFKVRDKKLILEGYRLNSGLCESLCTSFEIYPELLDSITLDNNGISDVDLAKVLEGLTKLDYLKRIIIRNNIFLEASCEVLRGILARSAPNNLEELRLISVRTNPLIMSEVCLMLAEGCHLQRLSLVEAELSDYNIAELC